MEKMFGNNRGYMYKITCTRDVYQDDERGIKLNDMAMFYGPEVCMI